MTVVPRRLVVVGSVIVDVLLYLEQFPHPGSASLAHDVTVAPGAGYNLIDAATKLGLPAAYLGFVGNGPFGALVRGALGALNVPVLLHSRAERDTGFDVGLVLAGTDVQPSFVGAPGIESTLELSDLKSAELQTFDAVYVSGYDLCYPALGEALSTWVPALDDKLLFVFDPGPMVEDVADELLAAVLGRADVVSVNRDEARKLVGSSAGIADDPSLARRLALRLRRGAWLVLRAGADGCWLVPERGEPTHVHGRPTAVVDTTGAGDTHLACLLARLAAGDSMPDAASWANVAASISVARRGPATSPTAAELAQHAGDKAALSRHDLTGRWQQQDAEKGSRS